MLFLSDRASESIRIQRVLERVRPCIVVPLHQALDLPAAHSAIICDVALDNMTSLEMLRAALSHHRPVASIPLLCLARDPSQLTLTQAQALGATAILPYQTSPARLIATLKDLIEFANSAGKSGQDTGGGVGEGGVQGSIKKAAAALSDLFDAARRRKPISTAALDHGGNAVLAAIRQSQIRMWLDIVWNYDDVTYQHCLLVAGLVAAFSIKLGLSSQSQRHLSRAALIHDIGKANIPYEILNKPGPLSPAELTVMRTHATVGYNLLAGQRGFDPRLLDVVRHHHEYLDGSGYPDGLQGEHISQFVRLVTICDIYAALIERRSYKAPMPSQKALSILADMGDKLDSVLLGVFHDAVRDV